jgi:adhesin transport system membrane fusion protein
MFKFPETGRPLKSVSRLRPSHYGLILAILILVTIVGFCFSLVSVQWYQSVFGLGKVIVYAPMDRAQAVDAQIPGRIERWYVREGDLVKKGQRLATLRDIDSKFLDPLQVQRTANMLAAYQRKRDLTRQRLQALQTQQSAILEARQAALPAAEQRIAQNQQRLAQNLQSVKLSRQNLQTDRLQMERLTMLEREGLRSRRDYELAEQGLVRSQTELERSELALGVAERDISVSRLDYQRLVANFENDLAKINESILKGQENLAEVEADIAKISIDLSSIQQRRIQQEVIAPRDGRVVRLLTLGEGETTKAGDSLCIVMPAVEDPAVELFITDSDAPLVRQGQRVRIMFDGFPAIPFTAFPWAEIGTFGGTVAVVDAVDDGSGRYRILITPEEHRDKDIPWPSLSENEMTPYPLRPGTQAQAWIIMDKPVPLYWELWRRLNAFPPVPMAESGDKKSKDGASKSPQKAKTFSPKPVFKR